jgi:hypothetical protein
MICTFLCSRALSLPLPSHGTSDALKIFNLIFIKESGYYTYHLVVSLEFFIDVILPISLWPWG